jgi:hypothetical protein
MACCKFSVTTLGVPSSDWDGVWVVSSKKDIVILLFETAPSLCATQNLQQGVFVSRYTGN